MRVVRVVLGLLAAVAVHTLGVHLVPGFSRFVDLFLLITVLGGLSGHSLTGLTSGLAAGLTYDALTGSPFGLFGFTNTLVGYLTARVTQRLVIQRASSVGLLTAGFAIVQQLVLLMVHALAAPPVPWPDLRWLLLRALTCGVLGGMLVSLQTLGQRAVAVRKQRRTRRLRMD